MLNDKFKKHQNQHGHANSYVGNSAHFFDGLN